MQSTTIRHVVFIAICCVGFSGSLFAQKVSFGVVTGSQLTEDFRSLSCPDLGVSPGVPPAGCPKLIGGAVSVADASQRFIVGPKVNIRFTRSLSVEVDALYRQIRSHTTWSFMFCPPDQIPSCAVLFPRTQSSIETEFSWEFPVLGRYQMSGRKLNPFVEGGPSFRPAENREQFGFTAGGGVEMRLQSLRLSPALRYTRWVNTGNYIGAIQDQLQFVLGIDGPDSTEPVSAFGRKVSLGIVAGLALTDGLRTSTVSFSDNLDIDPVTGVLVPVSGTETQNANRTSPVVGIVTEIATPMGISLEVGGMYRPLNARDISVLSNGVTRETNFTVLTWEFPILAKYKLPILKSQPFVELGPSLRASGNLNGANPSRYGFTGGAGMELKQRGMTIAPTLRFTHWAADSVTNGMATHQNQVELVFGVRF
jgi:hypothetical protein